MPRETIWPGPDDVREALLNLYSPAELARCSLAELLPQARQLPEPAEKADTVRSLMLDAIESLRTTGSSVLPASATRAHECITLRYVSGLPVEEVAEELCVSPRQVYRDLRWAEERLAEHIGMQEFGLEPASAPDGSARNVLVEEIQALVLKPEEVSLSAVVSESIATLAPLTARYRVQLRCEAPEAGIVVSMTPGVLREIVMQFLSAAVQGMPGAQMAIQVANEGEAGVIRISLGSLRDFRRPDLLERALRVAEAHNLDCRVEAPGEDQALLMRFPLARRRRLLVVEDNPSAPVLYERYLADTEWDTHIVRDPRLVPEAAVSKQAEAIILDIMMPEVDGWSVLQQLKTNPDTQHIPVVVCSVVDDPELGLALGAAACLTKPVSRARLLGSLRQVARERRPV